MAIAEPPARAVPSTARPPEPGAFEGADFYPADDLHRLATRLIENYDELGFLAEAEITYLWKAKGGQAKGKATLGKCQKPSGLLAFFAEADFVIWLAADHFRDMFTKGYGTNAVEAALYHELRHAGRQIDEEGIVGDWTVLAHDVEAFASEIKRYGLWKEDLLQVGTAVRQLRLDDTPLERAVAAAQDVLAPTPDGTTVEVRPVRRR